MLKQTRSQAALLGLSALLFLAPRAFAQNPPPPLTAGILAPAFTTKTVAGKPFTLRSLRGRVVLLDYWATWCGPCQMATPMLETLSQQFGKRGLSVVGMSVDDSSSVAQVRPFMKHFGITYIVTASPIANANAQSAYNVQGIPSQFLIDKRGIVRWSQSGFSMAEATDLPPLIRKLLAEK